MSMDNGRISLYKLTRLSVLIAAMLSMTACIVGPNYKRPDVTVPEHFKETKHAKLWKKAAPNDACQRGEWWKIFNDPELSRLETQLNESNQSIATAAANYRQALALVDEARASYFPVLTGSASVIRQKGAGTTNIISTSNGGIPSTGSTTTGTTATAKSPIRDTQSV